MFAFFAVQSTKAIKKYVTKFDADSMTGIWDPAEKLQKIHGHCKSSTGGQIRMATMTTSQEKYKVKLLDEVSEIWSIEYDTESSYAQIVADVSTAYGC